ncbi:MAG: glycosyltransferase [Anaerolineae bacterium]|nr:glycosyltransferase [Anaerolineae bacterium]
MDITVVICTYNRAATLHIPLDSMVKQHYPTEHFEVIVVDNNSTDATRHIVESYQERLPNLRYIFEPQQGLSIARNKGWQDAAAPIVAYLDDDAGACEKWLGEIVKVFEEETPRPACVGGPVQLDWGGKKPDWLPESYLQMYTQLDLGDERINLRINEHILQGAKWLLTARYCCKNRVLMRLWGAAETN